VLRTASQQAAQQISQELAASRSLAVEAQPETAYYEKQANQTEIIRTASLVIAFFMAIGAVFGITNTMFAAIGQRIKDIAVLRILGFTRREILLCFLLEALLIAFVGGAAGAALGYAINGLTLSSAFGAKAVAFAFQVDSQALITAAIFTLAMGLIGGLLPAMSAMRIKALESLR
jgi:ABC-type antimicrobial peptide transport system permease subunit